MSVLRRATDRLLPALLAAGGVVLLASGLITVAQPATAGDDVLLPTPSAAVATPTPTPAATGSAGPSEPPLPTPSASAEVAVASRVVIPALKIDLPVVAQTYGPGHGSYPLCDVAQYVENSSSSPRSPAPRTSTPMPARACSCRSCCSRSGTTARP